MMVKPASQGSSVGMTKVKAAGELVGAYAAAQAIDPVVFAESFVSGDEYTVSILAGRGAALDPHPAGDRVLRL